MTRTEPCPSASCGGTMEEVGTVDGDTVLECDTCDSRLTT